MKIVSSKPERKIICQINLLGSLGNDLSILDIGISDVRMEVDVDIGTIPTSE
jgi:hypothetical protein